MLKNPEQQTAGQEGKREAPKAAPGGGSLLDKVSADEAANEAAQQPAEGTNPGGQAPANGQPPPGGSAAPQ
jgi:hypothetical protein